MYILWKHLSTVIYLLCIMMLASRKYIVFIWFGDNEISKVVSIVFCFEYLVQYYTCALKSFMDDILMEINIILLFDIINKT